MTAIGPIVASAMVAAIGTGATFSKAHDFAARGTRPQANLDGRPHHPRQHIETGQSLLRVLFVQAAWVVLIRPKSRERRGLKSWLEPARQRLHQNVLAIALADKLARIAWSVLARGRNFEARKIPAAAQ